MFIYFFTLAVLSFSPSLAAPQNSLVSSGLIVAKSISKIEFKSTSEIHTPDITSTVRSKPTERPIYTVAEVPILPKCDTEGIDFSRSSALESIEKFCNLRTYWDYVIGSPVSYGTGLTADGRQKAGGGSETYDLDGTNKLSVGLMYSRTSGTGIFTYAYGNTDEERIDNCRNRFLKVVDGCQTSPSANLKGGTYQIGCRVYKIEARNDGKDPFDDWFKDQGDFTCLDGAAAGPNSNLHGQCTCFLAGYRNLTALFGMPDSKDCKDVDQRKPLWGG